MAYNGHGYEPMPTDSTAAIAIAASMLGGGSAARIPESRAKKAKKGILIPA